MRPVERPRRGWLRRMAYGGVFLYGLLLVIHGIRNFSCENVALGLTAFAFGVVIIALSVAGLRKQRRQAWRDIEGGN